MAATCTLIVLLEILVFTQASRILLIPIPHKGHVNFFSVAAKVLQDAGHDVHVLNHDTRVSMTDGNNVTSLVYTGDGRQLTDENLFLKTVTEIQNPFTLFQLVSEGMNNLCRSILGNHDLMKDLEKFHYDVVLVDGFGPARCFYAIPYKLGVRYITLTAWHDPWNAGIPALPSVETSMVGDIMTENSSFFTRLLNLLKMVMFYSCMPPSGVDDSIITTYAPTKLKTTLQQLFKNSEMWLVNIDTVCLEFPKPLGYHYQYIAGMAAQPPQLLPPELEEYVQGSGSGVIVFTLGSGIKDIPKDMLDKMMHAFARVPHRVIMRHSGEVPDKVPVNVKMLPWIPQNDLLGHSQTKLFITHGGNNGQMEAVYHAVPMINFPFFGDQFHNAMRAELKGFGVTLDHNTFTSDELIQAIKKTTTKEFQRTIGKCSERFHGLPSAADTLVFWVEHVVRFGGDHLKPIAIKVPIWKQFMLDILLFMLTIILLFCVILCICIQNIIKKFHPSVRHQKKED